MNEAYWATKVSRKIRIDEDWNVSTYDESGEDEFDVHGGGAETTLLTYAFAAATAKLIPAFKSAGIEAIPENEQVQEVETIPLVVDAPFSSLGPIYQRKVADKLPQAANQLILFNEATHMEHLKTMAQAGKIGKLYSVKFTGNLDEDAWPRIFEFGSEEITYLVDSDEDGYSEVFNHTVAF
jgi:DNA sulfur modification protein DndD